MSTRQRIGDSLALIGAALGIGFGVYLLVVGPETTLVAPDGPISVSRSPTPAGFVPLAIGVVAVWAVVTRRTSGFWLAAALAIAAAVLFLFSISVQLAAIAALLVVAAAVRTFGSPGSARR